MLPVSGKVLSISSNSGECKFSDSGVSRVAQCLDPALKI